MWQTRCAHDFRSCGRQRGSSTVSRLRWCADNAAAPAVGSRAVACSRSPCDSCLLLCLCQTPSGDEFATGSYGNTTMVVGADGQNHGWFEAGRQLLLQRPWRGPPARAKLDQRIMSLVRACSSSPHRTDTASRSSPPATEINTLSAFVLRLWRLDMAPNGAYASGGGGEHDVHPCGG